jgi:hypothetical protein
MIELIPASGERGPLIRLTPRQGFKKSHKMLEFPLQYGHRCPYCPNVINAVFCPDRQIDLFPYEETVVLSQGEKNAGEILKVVPGHNPNEGNYNIDYVSTPEGNLQRIRMKNHVVRAAAIQDRGYNGVGVEEVGRAPLLLDRRVQRARGPAHQGPACPVWFWLPGSRPLQPAQSAGAYTGQGRQSEYEPAVPLGGGDW